VVPVTGSQSDATAGDGDPRTTRVADLSGRVAVVTGGSRGIGRAIARRFAERGARVIISSRRAEGLAAAAAELSGEVGVGEVVAVAAHVADEEAAKRCFGDAVDRWGRVDVLVNNAGTNPHFGRTVDVDRGRWDKIIEVNLWATLRWTQLALEAGLGRSGVGSVINVSSNLSYAPGGPSGVYGLSKAALNYLTRQLAVELGPDVRVNAIAPGVIETDMAQVLVRRGEALSGQWPLPRFGLPVDVADVAEFLASPASSWMTGQILTVDGGAGLVGRREFEPVDTAAPR
jgi:NAD(P)-dependent dehydrogenase (short-subunit alcohol dehydrogenase family)